MIKKYRVLFIFLRIMYAAFVFYPAYSFASAEQTLITGIEVKGLTRITERELIDLMSINIGDVLDHEKLGKGVRRAFKKGIFRDVRVESEPYENGVKLTYFAEETGIVGKVKIEGNRAVSKRTIKKVLSYEDGLEFRKKLLDGAISRLYKYYRDKGFYDATINVEIKEDENRSVNMLLRIDEGVPQTIHTLNVPDEFKGYIHTKVGDVFDREIINRDIIRLREHLKKLDYIDPIIGPYQFSEGELSIPISKGKKVKIVFEKNKAINRKNLLKELTFIEDGDVTEDSVEGAAERIRNLYLREGYYNVKLASAYETDEDIITITFYIFEGEKVVVRDINFSGNIISGDVLKSIIPFKEDKPFDSTVLDDSREALIIFYNALGYLQAEVPEIKTVLNNDNKGMSLEFVINEGRQTIIKSVRISGNREIGTSDIQSVLQVKENTPYNIIDIRDARYRIQSLYGKRGYMDALIEVRTTIDAYNALIDYDITENSPSVVGKIIVRGNIKTKDKIIKREITLAEGETYNYEEVLNTKERLYRLGIFSEVKIDIINLDKKKGGPERDMLITLKESDPGSVEMSLGYGDYDKLRGSIDIRYKNIGGYNRQIGFRSEISSIEEKYVIDVREPRFFNKPDVPFNASLATEKGRSINVETKEVLYKIDKTSFIVGIEKELKKDLKAVLNYEYSYNNTTDVAPGVILSKEDTGTLAIGSISPSLFYDLRDNPFDPSSGSLHGLTLKFASKAYLSDTEFIKGTFQSSWFIPLKNRIVFALSLKGGVAYSFDEADELPLIERFFLGGRTTVRGYGHDMLGPKGVEDTPTGGNVFVLFNGEFRIPVRKGFGIVTFVDGGNVWIKTDDVNTVLKYTAGLGLRYATPVGPVRLDYGHKLSREQGESAGELHFSFGHAF